MKIVTFKLPGILSAIVKLFKKEKEMNKIIHNRNKMQLYRTTAFYFLYGTLNLA